jgi:hypothetical protein
VPLSAHTPAPEQTPRLAVRGRFPGRATEPRRVRTPWLRGPECGEQTQFVPEDAEDRIAQNRFARRAKIGYRTTVKRGFPRDAKDAQIGHGVITKS